LNDKHDSYCNMAMECTVVLPSLFWLHGAAPSRSGWIISGIKLCKNIFGPPRSTHINRVRGPMARRLTTNQEIAGSIPAVLIFLSVDSLHVLIEM
jgi:hypothetical protein